MNSCKGIGCPAHMRDDCALYAAHLLDVEAGRENLNCVLSHVYYDRTGLVCRRQIKLDNKKAGHPRPA